MKYKFSTDFETVAENIGVSNDRHDFFFEQAKAVSVAAIFLDKNIEYKMQAMEIYLNAIQPKNMVEAFWAGNIFDDVFSQTENLVKKILKQ